MLSPTWVYFLRESEGSDLRLQKLGLVVFLFLFSSSSVCPTALPLETEMACLISALETKEDAPRRAGGVHPASSTAVHPPQSPRSRGRAPPRSTLTRKFPDRHHCHSSAKSDHTRGRAKAKPQGGRHNTGSVLLSLFPSLPRTRTSTVCFPKPPSDCWGPMHTTEGGHLRSTEGLTSSSNPFPTTSR